MTKAKPTVTQQLRRARQARERIAELLGIDGEDDWGAIEERAHIVVQQRDLAWEWATPPEPPEPADVPAPVDLRELGRALERGEPLASVALAASLAVPEAVLDNPGVAAAVRELSRASYAGERAAVTTALCDLAAAGRRCGVRIFRDSR